MAMPRPATDARAPRRAAWTLLELLVVVAIMLILLGLTLSAVSMIREKAREHATATRMQNVLDGLIAYADSASGGTRLQVECGLGGVPYFAQISALNNLALANGGAKPPGFVQWTWHPPVAAPTWSRDTFDATNYSANPERITLWRRLIDAVYDAKPPSGTSWGASAAYETAGQPGAWPTQWPETDWDLATPGANPPILRFPWGKPGLRVDGSLCDPGSAAGATTSMLTEKSTSAGYTKELPPEPIQNNWVTTGAPATNRIWDWTPSAPTQTDAVTLTAAHRSDSGANLIGADPTKNANRALPFDEGWMSPLRTIKLLQAAGILEPGTAGADAYRTQRKPSAAWNDAWGRPLIVVYALFQPERYVRDFDGENRRDLLLSAASRAYQGNRAFYFAVGAPGATPDPTLAPPATWAAGADDTTLRDYWKQIRAVAGAAEFTEDSFTSPPWKNVKIGKKNGLKCLLTAPIETK